MNCLAHAWRFLDDGCFAAGTCVPDWLGMIDRTVRVRRKRTREFLEREEPAAAPRAIAAGILQHLDDDDWFHGSQAFAETSLQISRMIGSFPGHRPDHRSGFLGHILVELLLDACIEENRPGTTDAYYRLMETVSPGELQDTVNRLSLRPTNGISGFLQRFLDERFLLDYLDDGRLMYRMNRVLLRVKLEPLADRAVELIGLSRGLVRNRWRELLGEAAPPV